MIDQKTGIFTEILPIIWRMLNQQELINMSGLVGTGISIYLLWTIKSIRKDFLFAARLPQFQDGLQTHASEMNIVINAFESQSDDMTLLLALCKADLLSLQEKLSGSARKMLKKSITELTVDMDALILSPSISIEHARKIYVGLNGVIQQLRNLQEDQKWSVRDVG